MTADVAGRLYELLDVAVRLLDTTSFPVLFLLAFLTARAGSEFCHTEQRRLVHKLTVLVLLGYFIYACQTIDVTDWLQLALALVRAAVVTWFISGVLFFVVPFITVICRFTSRAVHGGWSLLGAVAACAIRQWTAFRHARKRRRAPVPEPYHPSTYEERLAQSVEGIQTEFEAEQAVVEGVIEGLDEDEQHELRDLPRQKMLMRLYRALGGEELE